MNPLLVPANATRPLACAKDSSACFRPSDSEKPTEVSKKPTLLSKARRAAASIIYSIPAICLLALLLLTPSLRAEWIWIEGEKPTSSAVARHPWYSQVKRDLLSGGDMISHFDAGKAGEATYRFNVEQGGEYTFWIRSNPIKQRLTYQLNGAPAAEIDMSQGHVGDTNIAADDKPDLRFIAWANVGKVTLTKGANEISFRFESANSHHGMIDCFLFTTEPFTPSGLLKPDEMAAAAKKVLDDSKGWLAWAPEADPFKASPVDLRFLNETAAGDGGVITARGEQFIHSGTREPIRFWGVNGPLKDTNATNLPIYAKMLAKHGVNLVRLHGAIFDSQTGEPDLGAMAQKAQVVRAMKAQGVYSLLSSYFPLWMTPKPGTPWLEGYDGKTHPFAALYFNKDFQAKYREWLKLQLTSKFGDGGPLVDDPAVMGVELVNEDSYFFWTFSEKNLPDPQLRMIEGQFAAWATTKYGSLAKAFETWKEVMPRDNVAENRAALRGLWAMANQRTLRDQDTAAFLFESQQAFYKETTDFLRGLGFKGIVIASNWTTADGRILGPLEKASYMAGDAIDHHGYFGANHKGKEAGWSIRIGDTYSDLSALRFDGEKPGSKAWDNPIMDPMYNSRPSIISETTFERPNRYRTEAPFLYAAYGALQDTDAIMNFALDSAHWATKPGFFEQPWTLMTPTQMGQFPATALIYRRGLVKTGEVVASFFLSLSDAKALKGSKLAPKANLDALRQADVTGAASTPASDGVDPLIHYVGRTNLTISETAEAEKATNVSALIDRTAQTVTSSTKELKLDYGKGVLTMNAPGAQGAVGNLRDAGTIDLTDITVASSLDLASIVAVPLDGLPLATSKKILLQVMSEEREAQFAAKQVGKNVMEITNIGQDPWLYKELNGTVTFKRADAATMKVTALDLNGYPQDQHGTAQSITLLPGTVYYYLEAP